MGSFDKVIIIEIRLIGSKRVILSNDLVLLKLLETLKKIINFKWKTALINKDKTKKLLHN